MKENDVCPYCNEGKLKCIPENEPWNMEHLQCGKCDSTYNLFEENPLLSDKAISIVAKRLEEQIDKDIVDNISGVLPPVCNCDGIKTIDMPCPIHDVIDALPQCPACNCQIDPDYCWCGEGRENHGYRDGHSFIPMGCRCGFAKGE